MKKEVASFFAEGESDDEDMGFDLFGGDYSPSPVVGMSPT